jgi:hypothetical protein
MKYKTTLNKNKGIIMLKKAILFSLFISPCFLESKDPQIKFKSIPFRKVEIIYNEYTPTIITEIKTILDIVYNIPTLIVLDKKNTLIEVLEKPTEDNSDTLRKIQTIIVEVVTPSVSEIFQKYDEYTNKIIPEWFDFADLSPEEVQLFFTFTNKKNSKRIYTMPKEKITKGINLLLSLAQSVLSNMPLTMHTYLEKASEKEKEFFKSFLNKKIKL